MSDTNNKPNFWVFALLASVALNGVLIGLFISDRQAPSVPGAQEPISISQTTDPRALPRQTNRLLRQLPRERRELIMTAAFKTLDIPKQQRPRRLMADRRFLETELARLAGQDKLDLKAFEEQQARISSINDQLAIHGNQLIIAILQEMTAEERKTVAPRLARANHRKKDRRKNRQKRRRDNDK